MILVARSSSLHGQEGKEADEALWVARAQDGDVDAFELIYRSYVGQIHALTRRMLVSRQDAEDVTQQVFVRAWQRLGSFRGEGPLGGWLRRIAFNLVADRHRIRQRAGGRTEGEGLDGIHQATAAASRVSDVAVDLERAVGRLPDGARQVLVLHDVEGLSHREIAELLGVSVGTSKTQLFRARRALKELLS